MLHSYIICITLIHIWSYTDNSDIFAIVLFLRNFAGAKFRENNTHAKWRPKMYPHTKFGTATLNNIGDMYFFKK